MFWGIDGCKGGWVAIGLSNTGQHHAVYAASIQEFWAQFGSDAQHILIDMPIGLTDSRDGRRTEQLARNVLNKRRSSVFNVPTRSAIEFGSLHDFASDAYARACDINREIEGKAFSKQSWNICTKIHQVDVLLREDTTRKNKLMETHPEILFWALNDKNSMRYSKKTGLGFAERLRIVELYQPDALEIISETYDEHRKMMVDDDILDALVCAVCARLGNFATLPENPAIDTFRLPMQMVYPTNI